MSALTDLRDRTARAAATLESLATPSTSAAESARLINKAAGVRLALSYIEEEIRLTKPPGG